MKKKTLYYCEKCGTAYAKKEDALECEKYHKTPKEIVPEGYTFKPKKVGPAWPYRIRVEDERGHTCEYIYNGHEMY